MAGDEVKETEVLEEQAAEQETPEEEPEVLKREDLLRDDPEGRETQLFKGFRIRALSAVEHANVEGAGRAALATAPVDSRLAEGRIAEMCHWLAKGVEEPDLQPDEWRFVLKQPGKAGLMKELVEAIQALTGIGDLETEIAKKALSSIQATSEN